MPASTFASSSTRRIATLLLLLGLAAGCELEFREDRCDTGDKWGPCFASQTCIDGRCVDLPEGWDLAVNENGLPHRFELTLPMEPISPEFRVHLRLNGEDRFNISGSSEEMDSSLAHQQGSTYYELDVYLPSTDGEVDVYISGKRVLFTKVNRFVPQAYKILELEMSSCPELRNAYPDHPCIDDGPLSNLPSR